MKPNPYTTHSSKIVYESQRMKVREDDVTRPDGQQSMYSVVETRDSVVIVALNEKEEMCMVNVFRYPQSVWAWELPGGGGDNEGPIHAAMRELAEETGYVASEYYHIGSLRLHGMLTEKMQVVVMRRLLQTGETHQAEEGIGEVRFQSLESIEQMIASGEIDDAQTIAALAVYKSWRNQTRPAPAT